MALIQWVQQVFWAMPSIEPLFCNALINYNIDSSIFCLCHSQATLWHPMCSVLSFLFYYLSHISSMICTLRTLQLSMGFLKENIQKIKPMECIGSTTIEITTSIEIIISIVVATMHVFSEIQMYFIFFYLDVEKKSSLFKTKNFPNVFECPLVSTKLNSLYQMFVDCLVCCAVLLIFQPYNGRCPCHFCYNYVLV